MDTPITPAWQPAFDAALSLPDGAAVLLLGGTDSGKTTFAAQTAAHLSETWERVAVVDADIGQSEIAPPGTVGVAWARGDAAKLSDLKPAATFFVGAFSASALPLEHAVAAASAVRHARARAASRVIVDTTGFVSGTTARRLKCAKAALIQPALILAFGAEQNNELLALARAMGATCGARILPVPVPQAATRKPPAMRTTRRQTRLAAYFGDKPAEVTVPLADVQTLGASLGTGTTIAPHLVAWAGETLHLPFVHGETAGDVLTLFLAGAERAGWESGIGALTAQFGVRTVRVVSLPAHNGVLVGLHDDGGRLFALGRYAGFDDEAVGVVVTVPGGAAASAREQTRLLAFGRVRVDAGGATIAEVKPGEL